MSGDYSRIAFDAWLDDLGVLLQQGRPLTDRDWNDLVLQLTRRVQAGTLDTIGAAVVPTQTQSGFQILATGGALTIGRGRIYVDGLLAENHGTAPSGGTLNFDPKLAELFGTAPLDYTAQPYYKDPPALPTGGPHLVYLDVWQREITRYIRPELIEPALGVDTSTRLQTVWQVKVHSITGTVPGGATCATPLDQFPGWLQANPPAAGRLTVTTAPVPGQPDPCQVPPSDGYKGLENQLYRVEIHTGGAPGTATFKWSRDVVAAAVTEIPSLTQIVVDSVGKDSVLRFSDGDLIEITDDRLELRNQPGILRRIAVGGGVDDATRTITLTTALPAGQFPTNPQNQPDAARHTRIRRWDQGTTVVDAAGVTIPSGVAADGSIVVPVGTTQILLEHNIVVSFSAQPANGVFRSGDYWVSAARTIDASVEELVAAPPRGIHHHYAKLALVTFPDSETDCRVFWPPPLTTGTGDADTCGCTVCVTPAGHASGALTVQMAIDQVISRGGGTVCLEVGTFALDSTLVLQDARSVHIVGKGAATRLQSTTRVVQVEQGQDVTLEGFAISTRPSSTLLDAAVVINTSKEVRLHELSITVENAQASWAAVDLAGALIGVSIRDCELAGAVGIRSAQSAGPTGLADLRIENNAFECAQTAIRLTGVAIHQFVSQVRGNRVTGCRDDGFHFSGATVPGHGLEVSGNVLTVNGDGIVSALDGLRAHDNDLLAREGGGDSSGVVLRPGAAANDSVDDVQIVGNRIMGFRGAGITCRAPRALALSIKRNRISRSRAGIEFPGAASLDGLAIENNQLTEIDGSAVRAEAANGTVIVMSNLLETRSSEAAVDLIFGRGDTVFSDNHCTREGGGQAADVRLRNRCLVVSSNRVQAGDLAMALEAGEAHFTVLGNICRGRITVNNSALGPPWVPLNRTGV